MTDGLTDKASNIPNVQWIDRQSLITWKLQTHITQLYY